MKKMPRNATASGRIGRKNSAAVPEDYSAADLARATVRADARPLLELPAAVGGEEQHSGAVVRAHEVAAPARRHRRLALDVHVERATVHVLRRESPLEGLARLVLGAHAEAPLRVRRQQRRDVARLKARVVRDAEVDQPRVVHAILRAGREVPGVLERDLRREAAGSERVVEAELDLPE